MLDVNTRSPKLQPLPGTTPSPVGSRSVELAPEMGDRAGPCRAILRGFLGKAHPLGRTAEPEDSCPPGARLAFLPHITPPPRVGHFHGTPQGDPQSSCQAGSPGHADAEGQVGEAEQLPAAGLATLPGSGPRFLPLPHRPAQWGAKAGKGALGWERGQVSGPHLRTPAGRLHSGSA